MIALETPGCDVYKRLGGFGQIEILPNRFAHEAKLMQNS